MIFTEGCCLISADAQTSAWSRAPASRGGRKSPAGMRLSSRLCGRLPIGVDRSARGTDRTPIPRWQRTSGSSFDECEISNRNGQLAPTLRWPGVRLTVPRSCCAGNPLTASTAAPQFASLAPHANLGQSRMKMRTFTQPRVARAIRTPMENLPYGQPAPTVAYRG